MALIASFNSYKEALQSRFVIVTAKGESGVANMQDQRLVRWPEDAL
jgi:hypothetical protein